jgi:hypothetical protein
MLYLKLPTFPRRRLFLDLLRRHAVAPRGLVLQQQLLQAQLAVVVRLPAAWRHAILLAACELLGGNVRGGFQVFVLCVFGNVQAVSANVIGCTSRVGMGVQRKRSRRAGCSSAW